ncbi:phosphate uptake regulator PhoU [Methanothrix thermoacetophila]|uniref:Phosphate uptake regulator, PhoU n=2 Tax=Methanothrix TaxID=2222 RepID=A0B6T7_METTP|nr:phosphate uptake regulator PhoU [Methanothrix thermoacetophila]ABK14411.1 phosphate uptake regulator, PhoU [Methanothrix thermoacetophila PT]
METRKVQRTGKSTFIVSLPKGWVVRSGIKPGSIVYITQGESGELVLSPERTSQSLKVKLDIGEKSGEALIRDIIGCYLSGYRTIEVVSPYMTPEQKRDIHQIVSKLIGPEILEETGNKVLIQDLLNSDELQSDRALRRLRTVVKSMIQDAIDSLIGMKKRLAQDVIQRDDDVDRLNLLVSRQFIEMLRTGALSQSSLDVITAFNYALAASNLERIADHAHSIANLVIEHSMSVPDDMALELTRISSIICGLIDEAISALLHRNTEIANSIIEQTKEIRREAMRSFEPVISSSSTGVNQEEILMRMVISSSIARFLDHIKNIGEFTINMTHAQLRKS